MYTFRGLTIYLAIAEKLSFPKTRYSRGLLQLTWSCGIAPVSHPPLLKYSKYPSPLALLSSILLLYLV